MIWILFAIVTASVILAVARPLGRAAQPAAGSASEIEAYKLQLAELDREQELGSIGSVEAEQTRTEISRRLLKVSRQAGAASSGMPTASCNTNIAFAALAGVIAIGSAGLYAKYGTPTLSDQPLEARLSAPPSQQPLAIQISNTERRLRANPDSAADWADIAPKYFRTMQFDKAAHAFRRAIRLGGQDEEKLLGLFEALVYSNEGNISAEAKTVLDTATAKYPKSLRARAWLAIRNTQEGKKAEAEQIYREMLSENPPGGWKGLIYKQLAALNEDSEAPAAGNSQPSAKAPATANAPMVSKAPKTAEAPAANQAPSIDSLVERLAARLKQNGADLNGWVMLIRSYSILNQPDKVQEAADSARKQFASDPEALKKIDAVLSMGEQEPAPASTKPAAPDEAKTTAPAAEAPAGGQAAMIRGMVDRLASRLKENGADLDGWLRLIRSYAVLNEPGKAQEAVASARKQFAADPEALKKIDAIAGDAGQAPAEGNPAPAAEAPAGGQAAMIRGMVDRLAGRLKENGADLDGWLRLIRSYAVLNEPGKAQEAAASARKQFASEPEALTRIEALTGELGIPAADGKGEQPKP
jgi:cytochrome c-type biogenesis protein CcmH